jgi:hypothetical protein
LLGHHVFGVNVEVLLVLDVTLNIVQSEAQLLVLSNLLVKNLSVELANVALKVIHEAIAVFAKLFFELNGELRGGKENLDNNFVRFVFGVHELGLADHYGGSLELFGVHEWHSSLSHNLIGVLGKNFGDSASLLTFEGVEDLNLIVNADT